MSKSSQEKTITGECNCGSIKATIPLPIPGLTLCHCIECRKETGTMAAYHICLAKDQLTIEGEPKIWINKGDSGGNVYRHFCETCGSPAYASCDLAPNMTFINSGLFPLGSLPAPVRHIYTKNMESWETPYPGTEQSEAM